MDEPQSPQPPPAQPPAEPSPAQQPSERKRRPLTPAELSRRYFWESLIPVVLLLWFGYDGWFTTDPDMQKHALFNRTMCILWVYWIGHCMYFGFKYRRVAKQQAANPAPPAAPS
jgi:hypothetical protein